ncbi:MAG: hypothetical protein CVT64_11305 [Actinobacteria bacterium HGW-Actinobacteria-4]|nr:MAG: hypothetical protein CVT64_11305 [Actinobacteria bacterium HGW-Actinobacteria-4]
MSLGNSPLYLEHRVRARPGPVFEAVCNAVARRHPLKGIDPEAMTVHFTTPYSVLTWGEHYTLRVSQGDAHALIEMWGRGYLLGFWTTRRNIRKMMRMLTADIDAEFGHDGYPTTSAL